MNITNEKLEFLLSILADNRELLADNGNLETITRNNHEAYNLLLDMLYPHYNSETSITLTIERNSDKITIIS